MSAASTPGSASKTMSSRLLTMKFMQRAANASPSSLTPTSPDEPSPKRRKTDSSSSTPSKVNINALADRAAIQDVLAKEEEKRQALLQRQAEKLGDTRWVLSFEDQKAAAAPLSLRVVPTDFARLDASPRKIQYMEDDEEEQPTMVGRRSFGRFNKVVEKRQNPDFEESGSDSEEDDDEDDSSSSESESADNDPTSELIASARHVAAAKLKADRKAKKLAIKAESEKMAKKRRKNEVNLNGLTSLSGKPERQPVVPKGMQCHKCGGNHFQRDCPNLKKRGHQGGDDGSRPKKMKKAK